MPPRRSFFLTRGANFNAILSRRLVLAGYAQAHVFRKRNACSGPTMPRARTILHAACHHTAYNMHVLTCAARLGTTCMETAGGPPSDANLTHLAGWSSTPRSRKLSSGCNHFRERDYEWRTCVREHTTKQISSTLERTTLRIHGSVDIMDRNAGTVTEKKKQHRTLYRTCSTIAPSSKNGATHSNDN